MQPEVSSALIESLGFPVAAFVIMLSLLYYIINKDEQRQEKSDLRYESLVKEFITTIKQITSENNNALKTMTSEIKEIAQELKIATSKLDDTRMGDNYAKIYEARRK